MSDPVARPVLNERFALEDRIGVGGMGSVYKAVDLLTGGRVAVKVLARELLLGGEAARAVERFQREAGILRLLKGDPYVVQFVDAGVSETGDHFIAMELLEGPQLRAQIGRGKRAMGLRTFTYYARHLIRGLIGIHARNLIHRDLAPDNVIVVRTPEGLPWPKFLDFGIGAIVEGDAEREARMTTIMGKPQSISPEQARGEPLTLKSDVYALGVLLYEMLTGHVPLDVQGMADLGRLQRDAPIPLTAIREGCRVPGDVQDVIMQCLEKRPEDRPDLDDVLAAIERFSDRLEAGEEFPTPEHATGRDDATGQGAIARPMTSIPVRVTGEFGPGDRIGRFEVRERIGRGGMGLVYLAWDPLLERDVAIKVASRVEESGARLAILDEARTLSHLKSENIVTIYEAGTEGGSPYIAMEYVRGPTLAQVIEAEGPIVGARFHRIASGIVEGLMYAHENARPVIHRDLKPANILIANDVAKISDFGIATVTGGTRVAVGVEGVAHRGATSAEGSVSTMSPEQANNKPADHRADIYSLGCVLYMMATGRAPFQGNQIAVLYQHVTRAPDPPLKVNPALDPPGLNAVILKCLEKDPARRYQSARALKEDLDPLFDAHRGVRGWHKSPVLMSSLAAIAIAGIAIAYALIARQGSLGGRAFVVTAVGGVPAVGTTSAIDGFVTRERVLDLEVLAGAAGDLRVSVEDGRGDVAEFRFPIAADVAQTVSVPLPDPGDRAPAWIKVRVDRPDNPEFKPKVLMIMQDLDPPRVEFEIYGERFEPSREPLRLLRIQDLKVIARDAGGLGEHGRVTEAVVGWNAHQDGVSLTRGASGEAAGSTLDVAVSAVDRAGRRTAFEQAVRIVEPVVDLRSPVPSRPVGSRTVHVDFSARLPDDTPDIPGLKADDLDLGTQALAARLRLPGGVVPVPLGRIRGGYAADVAIPKEAPPEFEFELEIQFEGDILSRTRHRFDEVPPTITVRCGDAEVSSARAQPFRPTLSVDMRGPHAAALRCRIEDGPGGIAGCTVEAIIDGEKPVALAVNPDGTFSLPSGAAEDVVIRLVGRDAASNPAQVEFAIVHKGLQLAAVSVGGREPDPDGRVFVSGERVAVRHAAIGLRDGDRAFARVLDDDGRVLDAVTLATDPGEAGVFQAPEVRLVTEGAASAVRRLRFLFGETAASAHPLASDLVVVCDREPPTISVALNETGEEIREDRTVGRFPELRVRVTDNVGLKDTTASALITWQRTASDGPDLVVEAQPGSPVAGDHGAIESTWVVTAPPGPARAERWTLSLHAADRAGNESTATFAIIVAPSEVSVLRIGDHRDFAQFGRSPATPLAVGHDAVAVQVRPPRPGSAACTLVARFPDAGPDATYRFPLSGAGATKLDFVVPVPRSGGGRRIDRGRLALFVEQAGSPRLDELAAIYYLVDQDPPSFEVRHHGRVLKEAEVRDWIRVASLGSLSIVVTDGHGAGFDDDAIADPSKMVDRFDERTHNRIVFTLRDDASFRGSATRTVDLGARDAAGNATSIQLRLARSEEKIEVRSITTRGGAEPLVHGGVIVLDQPDLLFTLGGEAVGYSGVKWVVKRGGLVINSGFADLRVPADRTPRAVTWLAAERAEPYEVAFHAYGPRGVDDVPLHSLSVLVDQTPPEVYLVTAADVPVPRGDPFVAQDLDDVRIRVEDSGAGLGANPVSADLVDAAGRRVTASVLPTRDGSRFRIRPPAPIGDGTYTIEVQARDRLGNETAEPRTYQITLARSAPDTRREGG